jgi:TPR repeat protein
MTPQWTSARFAVIAVTAVTLVELFGACSSSQPNTRSSWPPAALDADRRCEAGSVGACGELGRFLVRRTDSHRDVERGLVLLEVACGQDHLTSCTALAATYVAGSREPGTLARARSLATRACDGRFAAGCTVAGDVAIRVDPRNRNHAADDAFRAGCELGDARGCELYGVMQLRDRVGGDKAAAEDAFAAGCGLGRRSSCHLLATVLLRQPAKREAGSTLLTDNCNRGYADSCTTATLLTAPVLTAGGSCALALPFAQRACAAKDVDACAVVDVCKLEVAAEAPAAFASLRTACEARNALACLYWADASERGAGDAASDTSTVTDPERVRAAYEIACRGSTDNPEVARFACIRLAAVELARSDNRLEASRMVPLLERACDEPAEPSGEACCVLAYVHAAGKWVPGDVQKATTLREKACALGTRRCCAGGAPKPAR